MANHVMNFEGVQLANVKLLTMHDPEEVWSEHFCTVCERFLHSAALLGMDAFLGCQIQKDLEGKYRASVFSSAGAKVTKKDYQWMFEGCADVSEGISTDACEGKGEEKGEKGLLTKGKDLFWEKSRKIYVIEKAPYSDEDRHSEKYGQEFGLHQAGFLDCMRESGAAMRILAGTDRDEGQGVILLSMAEEMTLKMRAVLSLSLPKTVVREVIASDSFSPRANWLPMGCLKMGMLGLLELKRAELNEEEENRMMEEALGEEKFVLDDDYFLDENLPERRIGKDSSIDELELSVRAYNCLKRAGINTVGVLLSLSDEDFAKIRNLGKKATDEIKSKLTELGFDKAAVATADQAQAFCPASADPKPSSADRLQELIGLDNVKEQVKKITAFAKMKRDMKERGQGNMNLALNMEFIGNPGTAKTTVARILANIFHEIGLLPYGEVLEVGRADLVAGYVGQTADKVKSVFQKARGKVLFIDEAYSLVENRRGDYGDEAITTIVQEMENHRDETIVIFAGYPDEMEEFFSINPGLRSRVPFQISFADYSAEELVQITKLEAEKHGFSIAEQAVGVVADLCREIVGQRVAGNGRFCRNLVEEAILNYADRVYGGDGDFEHAEDDAKDNAKDNATGLEEKDFVLMEIDFPATGKVTAPKESLRIGF